MIVNVYSQTSHKRPLKIQTELVSLTGGGGLYKNRTTFRGSLSRTGPDTFTFWQRVNYVQFLSYVYVSFHVVTKRFRILGVAWFVQRTKIRHHSLSDRLQEVTYGRL